MEQLGFMLKNKGKLQLLNKLSVANQYIRQLQHDVGDFLHEVTAVFTKMLSSV